MGFLFAALINDKICWKSLSLASAFCPGSVAPLGITKWKIRRICEEFGFRKTLPPARLAAAMLGATAILFHKIAPLRPLSLLGLRPKPRRSGLLSAHASLTASASGCSRYAGIKARPDKIGVLCCLTHSADSRRWPAGCALFSRGMRVGGLGRIPWRDFVEKSLFWAPRYESYGRKSHTKEKSSEQREWYALFL